MIEKEMFVWWLSDECKIDLGEINDSQWDKIKENVRIIMAAKQTEEIGMAYIAAFLIFMYEMDQISEPFDSKKHLFN